MATLTLLASVTNTSSANDTIVPSKDFGSAVSAVLMLDVTVDESTAADKLNVYLDHSPDGGTTWDEFAHFTEHDGNVGATKYLLFWTSLVTPETEGRTPTTGSLAENNVLQGPVGSTWRVRSVIVDDSGSASYTYSVIADLQRDRNLIA